MMSSCRRLLLRNKSSYQQVANNPSTVTSGVAAAALYQLHNHSTSFKRYYSNKGDHEDEENGVEDDDDDDPYIDQERAPSTADMFKKVEKEMSHQAQVAEDKANVGFASQTVDKAYDACSTAKEAGPGGTPDHQPVKERYKETGSGEDYRRKE